MVRIAVGAVEAGVSAAASAHGAGAVVCRAQRLSAAQGQPVRAGARAGCAAAAHWSGAGQWARGGGAQRDEGTPAQSHEGGRGAARATAALSEHVFSGARHSRARQFIALSVQRLGGRTVPQRCAVPLPARALTAGRDMRAPGRGAARAQAVSARRGSGACAGRSGRRDHLSGRTKAAAVAAPLALAACAGAQSHHA
ncbi:hypothetical protein SDC9_129649 [bioreactor metagenome]|uniref:Uncharacterized protein n=1 Tax=bioreactor metagenome TaxID=1076179 RepID=A0A645D0E6_9ZZZZ